MPRGWGLSVPTSIFFRNAPRCPFRRVMLQCPPQGVIAPCVTEFYLFSPSPPSVTYSTRKGVFAFLGMSFWFGARVYARVHYAVRHRIASERRRVVWEREEDLGRWIYCLGREIDSRGVLVRLARLIYQGGGGKAKERVRGACATSPFLICLGMTPVKRKVPFSTSLRRRLNHACRGHDASMKGVFPWVY